jgi:hypothetical protein
MKTNHNAVRAVIGLAALLLTNCGQQTPSGKGTNFASSNDVAKALAVRMEKAQVIRTFGPPAFESNLQDGVTSATYLTEPDAVPRPKDFAFAGFEVFFQNGSVIQWNPIHSSTVIQQVAPTPDQSDSNRSRVADSGPIRPVSIYVVAPSRDVKGPLPPEALKEIVGQTKPVWSLNTLNRVDLGTEHSTAGSKKLIVLHLTESDSKVLADVTETNLGKRLLFLQEGKELLSAMILQPVNTRAFQVALDEDSITNAYNALQRLTKLK